MYAKLLQERLPPLPAGRLVAKPLLLQEPTRVVLNRTAPSRRPSVYSVAMASAAGESGANPAVALEEGEVQSSPLLSGYYASSEESEGYVPGPEEGRAPALWRLSYTAR